jgi:hypothetical protein
MADELKTLAADIVQQVSAIRELPLKTPVETTVLDQAGLDDYVRDSFERDVTPAMLAAQEGLYIRLGLLPSDASLERLYLDLLGSQVLGLYDDTDKSLYVVARGETVGGLEKITMSHELDHALQDQHFDLSKLLPEGVIDQSDRDLARRSVAEGDGTLLMSQWATQHLTAIELVQIAQAASDPEQQAILARTPAILSAPLQFPYVQGLDLVLGRYQAGGWAAVDALYADPPDTTEQVIHTDKLADREPAIDVALPTDLASRLGAGWAIAQEDTFGEYLTSVWLDQPAGASGGVAAGTAAAGWGGDRMAYLTGPDGADLVVWSTAWDTAADAQEFLQAASPVVEAGGGGHAIEVDPGDPTRVWIVMAGDQDTMCRATAALGFAACRGA